MCSDRDTGCQQSDNTSLRTYRNDAASYGRSKPGSLQRVSRGAAACRNGGPALSIPRSQVRSLPAHSSNPGNRKTRSREWAAASRVAHALQFPQKTTGAVCRTRLTLVADGDPSTAFSRNQAELEHVPDAEAKGRRGVRPEPARGAPKRLDSRSGEWDSRLSGCFRTRAKRAE